MQEEVIVTKEELKKLFEQDIIKDTKIGWILDDKSIIQIIALHEKEIKYVNDITNANFYKIVKIEDIK